MASGMLPVRLNASANSANLARSGQSRRGLHCATDRDDNGFAEILADRGSDVTEFWDRLCIPVAGYFSLSSWSRRLAGFAQDELKRVAVGLRVVPQPFVKQGQADPGLVNLCAGGGEASCWRTAFGLELLQQQISACRAAFHGSRGLPGTKSIGASGLVCR